MKQQLLIILSLMLIPLLPVFGDNKFSSQLIIEKYEYVPDEAHEGNLRHRQKEDMISPTIENSGFDSVTLSGWVQLNYHFEEDAYTPIVALVNDSGVGSLRDMKPLVSLALIKLADDQYCLTLFVNLSQNSDMPYTCHFLLDSDAYFQKWTLFRLSYNAKKQWYQGYLKFPSEPSEKQIKVKQTIGDKLRFLSNFSGYKKFMGKLERVVFSSQDIATDEEMKHLALLNPGDMPTCSVAFSECNYSGESSIVCDHGWISMPNVKSVFIAIEGQKIRKCIKRQHFTEVVTYSKQFDCSNHPYDQNDLKLGISIEYGECNPV